MCDSVGDSGAVTVCDIFRAGMLVILKLFCVLPKDLIHSFSFVFWQDLKTYTKL